MHLKANGIYLVILKTFTTVFKETPALLLNATLDEVKIARACLDSAVISTYRGRKQGTCTSYKATSLNLLALEKIESILLAGVTSRLAIDRIAM